MRRHKFIIVYSMALLGLMPMVIGTVAQQSTLKEQVVGTWSLVSAANEIDGKRIENFGSNPLGYMMFTSDGHFSVNFVRANRPNFVSNNRETGTPEENRAAVQGNISAFGTYTLDPDGSVTFRIIGSSFPNWNGTVQKRIIEVNGDQLKYITPATSIGGSAVSLLTRAK
jgi:Lipocalin-like domain